MEKRIEIHRVEISHVHKSFHMDFHLNGNGFDVWGCSPEEVKNKFLYQLRDSDCMEDDVTYEFEFIHDDYMSRGTASKGENPVKESRTLNIELDVNGMTLRYLKPCPFIAGIKVGDYTCEKCHYNIKTSQGKVECSYKEDKKEHFKQQLEIIAKMGCPIVVRIGEESIVSKRFAKALREEAKQILSELEQNDKAYEKENNV